MHIPYYIWLPIIGGIYGGFVGGYIKRGKHSAKQKTALLIIGVILAVVCLAVLIDAFSA